MNKAGIKAWTLRLIKSSHQGLIPTGSVADAKGVLISVKGHSLDWNDFYSDY